MFPLPLLAFWLACGALTASLTEWSILSTDVWWLISTILAVFAGISWLWATDEKKLDAAGFGGMSLFIYSVILAFGAFHLSTGWWVGGMIASAMMFMVSCRGKQPHARAARA